MELWIARDKDGGLYVYHKKPLLMHNQLFTGTVDSKLQKCMNRNKKYYRHITFKNSPQRLKLKLVDK